jgi:hypothetical protein
MSTVGPFQVDIPTVAMIDDFRVPGDEGYAYDDYGPGKALTADYLPTYRLSQRLVDPLPVGRFTRGDGCQTWLLCSRLF